MSRLEDYGNAIYSKEVDGYRVKIYGRSPHNFNLLEGAIVRESMFDDPIEFGEDKTMEVVSDAGWDKPGALDKAAKIFVKLAKKRKERSGGIDGQIEKALISLHFHGEDEARTPEKDGNWWTKDFRVYNLFTPRTREDFESNDEEFDEDDDWPTFTGYKKVQDIVQKHFADLIKKGCKATVEASEKSWFTVRVELPKKG